MSSQPTRSVKRRRVAATIGVAAGLLLLVPIAVGISVFTSTFSIWTPAPGVEPATWLWWFWTTVAAGTLLAALAVAALAVRAWVALGVAILAGALSVAVALGVVSFPDARRALRPAPVVTVDSEWCACHSGSPCDCPGG